MTPMVLLSPLNMLCSSLPIKREHQPLPLAQCEAEAGAFELLSPSTDH